MLAVDSISQHGERGHSRSATPSIDASKHLETPGPIPFMQVSNSEFPTPVIISFAPPSRFWQIPIMDHRLYIICQPTLQLFRAGIYRRSEVATSSTP